MNRKPTKSRKGAAEPTRTCVGCRAKRGQSTLVRVTRRPDGTLALERGAPGRGAWLCADRPTCVDDAAARGAFAKALRAEVSPQAIDDLRARLWD